MKAAQLTNQAPPSAVRGSPHLAVWVIAFAGVAAVLAVDQISKSMATQQLLDGPSGGPGPFWFRLVANRGALMGLPVPTWLLVVLTCSVAAGAVLTLTRTTSRRVALGYALLLGGAAGNLVDRFQHRPRFPDHAVVDWIASTTLPTFNLADVGILAGMVLLATATRPTATPVRPRARLPQR